MFCVLFKEIFEKQMFVLQTDIKAGEAIIKNLFVAGNTSFFFFKVGLICRQFF